MELTKALPRERTTTWRNGRWAIRVLAAATAGVGALLAGGGLWLLVRGGSTCYVVAGIGYLVASTLLWRHRASGAWLMLALFGVTLWWALWEVGFRYWAMFPRVVLPGGLALLALVAGLRFPRNRLRRSMTVAAVMVAVGIAVDVAMAFVSHGVVHGAPKTADGLCAAPQARARSPKSHGTATVR